MHHFQDDTSLVSDPKEGRDEKERGKKESSTYVQLMMLRKLHYEVLYKYSDTRITQEFVHLNFIQSTTAYKYSLMTMPTSNVRLVLFSAQS